jgi:hypothetical protein
MYEFVAHLLTWPTRVRGTLHVISKTSDALLTNRLEEG